MKKKKEWTPLNLRGVKTLWEFFETIRSSESYHEVLRDCLRRHLGPRAILDAFKATQEVDQIEKKLNQISKSLNMDIYDALEEAQRHLDENGIPLTDNYLFQTAMTQNKKLCKRFLSKVLKRKIRDLVFQTEKSRRLTRDGKGTRLDVEVTLGSGEVVDIEMQTTSSKDFLQRVSFYRATIVSKFLTVKSKGFQDVKPVIIIFLTTFDPFGKGNMLYSFQGREESDLSVIDPYMGHNIFLYLNGRANVEDVELVGFARYLGSNGETQPSGNNKMVGFFETEAEAIRDNSEWRLTRMALDVYTIDRLEGIRQEEQKKYEKQLAEEKAKIVKEKEKEKENSILMVIRIFRNSGITAENLLRGIMESFHLSHDEATAYLQKA